MRFTICVVVWLLAMSAGIAARASEFGCHAGRTAALLLVLLAATGCESGPALRQPDTQAERPINSPETAARLQRGERRP